MSASEELARLAKLRDDGVLTEAEFKSQKAAVMAGDRFTAADMKPARSVGKKIGIGCAAVIAIVVVLIIVAALGAKGDGDNSTTVPPKPAVGKASTVDAAPEADAGAVTKANYDRIKTGMTYQAVVAILGSPGEEMSRNEIAGTETVMYMWQSDTFGGNMNAMFQNNKLVQKAQFGVK